MRSISDVLLDMDDRGRIAALVLPVVAVITFVVAGFYACGNGKQAVTANEVMSNETEYATDDGRGSNNEESPSEQATEAEDSEEGQQPAAVPNDEEAGNGYRSETVDIDSASRDDAINAERGQILQVGEDSISSNISVQIVPDHILTAIREALGDSPSAISAALTGEARDSKYRQLAVANSDGTLLCLEMPAGTNGPITARKVTVDEFRRLNLGTVIGHEDEEVASKGTEANGNGQQQ